MVKIIQVIDPYSIMLDVGGAIMTVHSMRDNETEVTFGGIKRDVTVAGNLTPPQKIEGTTLFVRYESTRDGTAPKLESRTRLESEPPQGGVGSNPICSARDMRCWE